MTELLREYVRLILERAKTPQETGKLGLALHIMSSQQAKQVVLWDPRVLLDVIVRRIEGVQAGRYNVPSDIVTFFHELKGINVAKLVRGVVRLTPPDEGDCRGAWMVKLSMAEKGYGPMLYDVAMSMAPSRVIMPDRLTTSQQAGGVWKFYADKRGDVKALPLDDITSPRTPPTYDDCTIVGDKKRPWLDMAYVGSSTPETARLTKNSESAVYVIAKTLESNGLPADHVQSGIEWILDNAVGQAFYQRLPGA